MATLTMVMVLFFVIAMVAAYTNRNMLFEQRMAINNFRTTAAMAAADAGVDWAVAMLNGAPVDGNCVANNPPAVTDVDFRSRYAVWQPDGDYVIPTWLNGLTPTVFTPSCVLTAAGWTCRCPSAATPQPVLPYPSYTTPIFDIQIGTNLGTPGLLTVNARGSHEASAAQSFGTFGNYNRISVSLGLARALPVPPTATLTAGGIVAFNAAGSSVFNADQRTGFTVHSGAPVLSSTPADEGTFPGSAGRVAANAANATLGSAAGSLGGPDTVIESDTALRMLVTGVATPTSPAPVDFFRNTFGMDVATYRDQPAAVRIACPGGTCTSGDIDAIVAANPGRIIWVDGDLDLTSANTLGSIARPLMLLASGNVTLSSLTAINGFVYSDGNIVWKATAAGSVLRGAMMAKGMFLADCPVVAVYDDTMMQRISLGYGSFARLPGSWQVLPIQ